MISSILSCCNTTEVHACLILHQLAAGISWPDTGKTLMRLTLTMYTATATTMTPSYNPNQKLMLMTMCKTDKVRQAFCPISSETMVHTRNKPSTAPLVPISMECFSTSLLIWRITMPPPPNGMAHAYTKNYSVLSHHRQILHLSSWLHGIIPIFARPTWQISRGSFQWRLGLCCSLFWHHAKHREIKSLTHQHLVYILWCSKPFFAEGQHAGWIQIYGGLLFFRIKGGSHMVPQSKRAEAYELFKMVLESVGNFD